MKEVEPRSYGHQAYHLYDTDMYYSQKHSQQVWNICPPIGSLKFVITGSSKTFCSHWLKTGESTVKEKTENIWQRFRKLKLI